ncbi:glycosyl transferase [Sphingobacteriales bacterium UPWRP_1]|nr:hypothetical protein B6N25_06465 [Sphingobacteriales bacterium TSM_CSS]PSJ72170.1 glycosyl transferase [Sphingobacteriales bacterium UPWRP_1]
MKILYAVQATGNGHISRAIEIIPHLQQYGQVDVFVSGTQAHLNLPFEIKEKKNGVSFCAGKKGGIDWFNTVRKIKPLRFFRDVWQCKLHQYNLIINDFEPVTAWACKWKGTPCFAMSHQAAFMSAKCPRPTKIDQGSEWLMRNYAPAKHHIGFHFQSYDSFIYQPVIRSEIRNATVSNNGHIAVYLPAYHESILIQHFHKLWQVQWLVFTKNVTATYTIGNVTVQPIANTQWVDAVASSEGVLMGAGFEGPAEALYLGKKLMVIPMDKQYEQLCNATALQQLGVRASKKIGKQFTQKLHEWICEDKPVRINYIDNTLEILSQVVKGGV